MDPEITQNNSQQQLVREGEEICDQKEKTIRDVKFREWVAVFVLCFVNLINYMDRFTIAGKSLIHRYALSTFFDYFLGYCHTSPS